MDPCASQQQQHGEDPANKDGDNNDYEDIKDDIVVAVDRRDFSLVLSACSSQSICNPHI